jgi:hypothetical protein
MATFFFSPARQAFRHRFAQISRIDINGAADFDRASK